VKYLRQFGVILLLSLLGELLHWLIPFTVPASIYGLVLMLTALCTGLIKVEDVRETAGFLIEIMPLMFIPAAVGLLTALDVLRQNWLAYVSITVVSTFVVMAVTGRVTQALMRGRRAK